MNSKVESMISRVVNGEDARRVTNEMAGLSVGDKVKITGSPSLDPSMKGLTGTVEKVDGDTVHVLLDIRRDHPAYFIDADDLEKIG